MFILNKTSSKMYFGSDCKPEIKSKKMNHGTVHITEVLFIEFHYHMSVHLKVQSQCKLKLMTHAK